GDQAAQHEDQAKNDGQMIGDPEPAVGDRAGDAFGVPDRGCRMEEGADQPQQGAGDARVRPDAQDPPCGCGGGGHHRSPPAGWSWLVRASRASSTSAPSTASDSRLEVVTGRAPNRTATNPTPTHGRSRSSRKSSTKIGYTSRLMVKGVTSEVNGQPLLSARSTWSMGWGKGG